MEWIAVIAIMALFGFVCVGLAGALGYYDEPHKPMSWAEEVEWLVVSCGLEYDEAVEIANIPHPRQ